MYEYRADVLRVIDGDTIDVRIDLGLSVHVEERIRLIGIDAPEMTGETREAGIAAREALIRMIEDRPVLIRTIKDRRGKYGRYLGRVWTQGDGARPQINVNDALVADGFATLTNY